MSGDRDAYPVVGAALRKLVADAASVNLTPRQYRVILAVLHYTVSYSRLHDDVAVGQLADLTGIDRRHVRRCLSELSDLGLVVYEHGDSPKGRARYASRVGLHPDPDRGPAPAPGSEERTGGQPRPSVPGQTTGGQSGHDRGPAPAQTGGRSRRRPGASPGPPPEKTPEEASEVRRRGRPSAGATGAPRRTEDPKLAALIQDVLTEGYTDIDTERFEPYQQDPVVHDALDLWDLMGQWRAGSRPTPADIGAALARPGRKGTRPFEAVPPNYLERTLSNLGLTSAEQTAALDAYSRTTTEAVA